MGKDIIESFQILDSKGRIHLPDAPRQSLNEARKQGQIDQFIVVHEAAPPGDEAAFNATLQLMAGKSKAVPAASPPDAPGD